MEANNMSAMREAFLALYAWAKTVKENPKDKTAIECAEFVEQTAKEAIAKPPRNCDRFNNESEMQFAFLAELISMGRNRASLEEYSKWLLAEANGERNESNESK